MYAKSTKVKLYTKNYTKKVKMKTRPLKGDFYIKYFLYLLTSNFNTYFNVIII